MTRDDTREMSIAVTAVQTAARVCQTVQAQLVTADTLEKKDKSPVTVADFASQAVICGAIASVLPDDPIVGEEDASDLRESENQALRESVVQQVAAVVGDSACSPESVLEWIDRGGAVPTADTPRFWTLDPIDGTKGFLRGEQYAIALALIEEGRVVLGVLGCPNLEIDGQKGTMMLATREQGTKAFPIDAGFAAAQSVHVSKLTSPAEARFCESVESGHSDQGAAAEIAQRLGITAEPYRIDSQCKYASVARADASIYLRLPTRKDYREKIWDHAAGSICVEAAGGTVTDAHGKPLDFTLGRQLENNAGIIATNGQFHDQVVQAVAPTLT